MTKEGRAMKKTATKDNGYRILLMPTWRDGQPACANLKCLTELWVGKHVVQAKSQLYYCSSDCADKREKGGN